MGGFGPSPGAAKSRHGGFSKIGSLLDLSAFVWYNTLMEKMSEVPEFLGIEILWGHGQRDITKGLKKIGRHYEGAKKNQEDITKGAK